MKITRSIVAALVLVSAFSPEMALAKKKKPTGSSSSSHVLSADQKKRMLADCYKRFPLGANTYLLRYETHYGRSGWWCVPIY